MFGRQNKDEIEALRSELTRVKVLLEEARADRDRLTEELQKAHDLIHSMEEDEKKSIGTAIDEMMNGANGETEVVQWATK